MRRNLLLLLFLPFGEVYSQLGSISGLPESEPRRIRAYGESDGYHGDLRTGLGFATIDGGNYLSLNFQPNLQMGKLRAAFDLEFYFGGDGSFKFRETCMMTTLAGCGLFATSTGQRGRHPAYRCGQLLRCDLRFWMLVSHYNNAPIGTRGSLPPNRLQLPRFNIETFSSNLLISNYLLAASLDPYRYNTRL